MSTEKCFPSVFLLWPIMIYGLLTSPILGRVTATAWRQLLRARDSPLPPWQINHTTGVYIPYSFRTAVWVLLRPFPIDKEVWRRQGQRLNVTAHWRDHLNWDKVFNHSQHDLTSYFKDPGWWSGRGLNPRPTAQQTGAHSTELTGRRLEQVHNKFLVRNGARIHDDYREVEITRMSNAPGYTEGRLISDPRDSNVSKCPTNFRWDGCCWNWLIEKL